MAIPLRILLPILNPCSSMKFSHFQAFEKHLSSASPDQLSSVYLIVDSEEYVQKKLAKMILKEKEEWQLFVADELNAQKLDELLNSFSMFSKSLCVCLVGIEKLSKNLFKQLTDYLKKPRDDLRLIATASVLSKEFTDFAKVGIVLDLSGEKSWDREKRLSLSVMQRFKDYQLKASSAICDGLVKLCGAKEAFIDQEVEKLALCLYGKGEVTRHDLDFILPSIEQSIFKVGQAVFSNHLQEALQMTHQQKFPLIMLIYSLRSTLQRSYRLKGMSSQECAEKVPQLKGYLLEKSLELANQFSVDKFKKMLIVLFQTELLAKSQALPEEFLTSLLLLKLGSI